MNYIIFKNKNSNDIKGLLICKLPPITKPKMRTNTIVIDGKSGDEIEKLGYQSYNKTIDIALTRNYNVDEVISYFNGEGNLILSNEPDKYYKVSVLDNIDFEKLINFKTAKVNFYVQPYKYKLNEAEVVANATQINNKELIVNNVGLEKSKPLIHLYGEGIINFSVNNIQLFTYEFDESNEVIIDCEKEDAYLNDNLKNRNMNGVFPILHPGGNIITWSGTITSIKVEPKSRWL